MKSAITIEDYINNLIDDRKEAIIKIRKVINENLPKGFEEEMSYGMIGYVVPHSIYPNGYHTNKKLPLPFINIASQKNYIAFHHLGLYASKELLEWFVNEYPKYSKHKLDMGKGCVRFKKTDNIPYKLIGELIAKISVKDWINFYESNLKSK